MNRLRIADADQPGERQTLKFVFQRKGRPVEGFLARFNGKLVAYENACRHIPITLDYGDGRFFTREGNHFICQSHGAVYEPLSGKCIAGPCTGEKLKPLLIEMDGDGVWLLLDEPS